MINTLISFDFETTGLYPIKDKIVEIGAIRFNPEDGKEIDSFKTFVNPGRPIPQEVIKIHGITDEMVRNAPYEKDALLSFLKYIGDDPLIGHNVAFDVGFLMAAVAIYKIKTPNNVLLDSCELAKMCFKDVENHKLSTLCTTLDIKNNGYHRALADSYAVIGLYKKCLERLESKMTIQEIAHRTTSGLRFADYIFDKIELPDDKIALTQAIDKGRPVEIKYRNNKGDETQREIMPFNIYSFLGKTYVSAYCHNCSEDRQFRLDRILEVTLK
ncbi:MAG: exonuclease domain-containing protein [Planctomycetota bacterium]